MQMPDTEKSAWNIFYKRFATIIFVYISRQVANRQDVEDLLLEVFFSASQEIMLEELPEDRQLMWLRKVARNKVIDYYRHHKLVNWLPLAYANKVIDKHLTPEEQFEQQETYTRLFRALQQLSQDQQELIQLRYGDELKLAEIAGMLGKPEGTVRKLLTRTRRQLRTLYEQLERGKDL